MTSIGSREYKSASANILIDAEHGSEDDVTPHFEPDQSPRATADAPLVEERNEAGASTFDVTETNILQSSSGDFDDADDRHGAYGVLPFSDIDIIGALEESSIDADVDRFEQHRLLLYFVNESVENQYIAATFHSTKPSIYFAIFVVLARTYFYLNGDNPAFSADWYGREQILSTVIYAAILLGVVFSSVAGFWLHTHKERHKPSDFSRRAEIISTIALTFACSTASGLTCKPTDFSCHNAVPGVAILGIAGATFIASLRLVPSLLMMFISIVATSVAFNFVKRPSSHALGVGIGAVVLFGLFFAFLVFVMERFKRWSFISVLVLEDRQKELRAHRRFAKAVLVAALSDVDADRIVSGYAVQDTSSMCAVGLFQIDGLHSWAFAHMPITAVQIIDGLFSRFDRYIQEKATVEKGFMTGDTYVVTYGLRTTVNQNVFDPTHVVRFCARQASTLKGKRLFQLGCKVGVASGPACGTLISATSARYCVDGAAFTMARLLATVAPPGRVALCAATVGACCGAMRIENVRFATDGGAVTAALLISLGKGTVEQEPPLVSNSASASTDGSGRIRSAKRARSFVDFDVNVTEIAFRPADGDRQNDRNGDESASCETSSADETYTLVSMWPGTRFCTEDLERDFWIHVHSDSRPRALADLTLTVLSAALVFWLAVTEQHLSRQGVGLWLGGTVAAGGLRAAVRLSRQSSKWLFQWTFPFTVLLQNAFMLIFVYAHRDGSIIRSSTLLVNVIVAAIVVLASIVVPARYGTLTMVASLVLSVAFGVLYKSFEPRTEVAIVLIYLAVVLSFPRREQEYRAAFIAKEKIDLVLRSLDEEVAKCHEALNQTIPAYLIPKLLANVRRVNHEHDCIAERIPDAVTVGLRFPSLPWEQLILASADDALSRTLQRYKLIDACIASSGAQQLIALVHSIGDEVLIGGPLVSPATGDRLGRKELLASAVEMKKRAETNRKQDEVAAATSAVGLVGIVAQLRKEVGPTLTAVFARGSFDFAVVLGRMQPIFELQGVCEREATLCVAAAPPGFTGATSRFYQRYGLGLDPCSVARAVEPLRVISATPSVWRIKGVGSVEMFAVTL